MAKRVLDGQIAEMVLSRILSLIIRVFHNAEAGWGAE